MEYSEIFQFKGTWRSYQARVLKNLAQYKKDGHIHIVAAPGSGKTTLGIELIIRFNKPALVLAPSVTIREQWVERITEAFLKDGQQAEDYLSQNLKAPKLITVATYQALHSAMTKYRGTEEEDDDEVKHSEEVDYSDFDVIEAMKAAGTGVLCLDECHHLRSEWWKALEGFQAGLGNPDIIALTATPPYDSTPALWERYMNMCGEIDEEITIPELVKEGSLCAHQDFVYFNYPTEEEKEQIAQFQERSRSMYEKLMQSEDFLQCVKNHDALRGQINEDKLLEKPSYFASLLIYLRAKQVMVPSKLENLLGAKQLPKMEPKWLELLLQGILYEDLESYGGTKAYREELEKSLKAAGLIEKKKVSFTVNANLEKLLLNSKGKCSSIRDIVAHEYQNMGKDLRLLLLTDYIRKEYEKAVGNPQENVISLGVLPFFEQLRREHPGKDGLRLGILCGTIVVIPAEAKEALEEIVGESGKLTFARIGALEETDYLKVSAVGDSHFLTGAVTELFTRGYMQILIGTKSLLGEGWDSPCINALILASFVGSFMLSNQMRGRAIRVFKEQPDKTSNIWHLVCLNPQEETGGDFALLKRRMEHFLGLHYTQNVIETGMERLSVITPPPYNEQKVDQINAQMLSLSDERSSLKERWKEALIHAGKMSIADETEVEGSCVTEAVFRNAFRKTTMFSMCGAALLGTAALGLLPIAGGLAGVLGAVGIGAAVVQLPRAVSLSSPQKRLKACGNGIYAALKQQGLLEGQREKVMVETGTASKNSVYLTGESGRDKAIFAQCVREFFGEVDNQRYLLVKEKNHRGTDGFYCVPECFAKRKEDAEVFVSHMKKYIGAYELVYTRNERGRQLLLEGRMRAFGSREARCISHKKVKGALE